MHASGALPSVGVTLPGAVVALPVEATPITANADAPLTTDSTNRNLAEATRDKTNANKTGAADGIVKRGWWQRFKGWVFHIPPKDLVTGGKGG